MWCGLIGTYRASYTWFEAAILRPRNGDPNTPCRIADEVRKNGLTDVTDPNRPFPETGWELVPQPYNREGNWEVQINKGSWAHEEEHIVEWNGDEKFPGGSEPDTTMDWDLETGRGFGVGFLKSLKPGDRVVLLAKAQFPGWVNNVQGATVEITWIPL